MPVVRIHRVRAGGRPGLEATVDGGRFTVEFQSPAAFRAWSDSYDMSDIDAMKIVCKERLTADPSMSSPQSWIGQTTVTVGTSSPPS